MTENVITERRGAVAIVTMNLPHKRNALSPDLYEPLLAALGSVMDSSEVRAVVLSGGRHFCSGGDVSVLDTPVLAMRSAMNVGQRIVRLLTGGPLPVVAAVEGGAYGAGFSMALACDFVVADTNTSFCAAFAKVGLMPDYGLLWSLPQRVNVGVAREILMLAEPIGGERGRELGLVDRLAETGQVLPTAIALAERLALAPPGSISATKAGLSRFPMALDPMLAWEADTQSLLGASEDLAEGVRAFRERRAPLFRGR